MNPSVRAYTPTRSSKPHPWAPPPDPRLKPGPVFVASGGVKIARRWFGVFPSGYSEVPKNRMRTRNRAVSYSAKYVDRYNDKSPKEALGIFRSRIRRV